MQVITLEKAKSVEGGGVLLDLIAVVDSVGTLLKTIEKTYGPLLSSTGL